jgi:hypothetical protein
MLDRLGRYFGRSSRDGEGGKEPIFLPNLHHLPVDQFLSMFDSDVIRLKRQMDPRPNNLSIPFEAKRTTLWHTCTLRNFIPQQARNRPKSFVGQPPASEENNKGRQHLNGV